MAIEHRMTPPLEPGAIEPRAVSVWPMTIGVISIVLGSLGLLNYGCNAIGMLVAPMMTGFMESLLGGAPGPGAAQLAAQTEIAERYMAPQVILTLLALALSGWLLAAGIAMVRRRRSARALALGWSIAKLIHIPMIIALGVVVSLSTIEMLEEMVAADPQAAPPASAIEMMYIFGVAGSIFWAIVLACWPVFLLIWFRRAKISEEVKTWR